MPPWSKVLLDRWLAAANINQGTLFRPVKGQRLNGDSISTQSVAVTVKRHARRIGVPQVACHDLRRSYARLARKGGAQLEQLQLNLGHSSVETTQRYIHAELDLQACPCDFLGLQIDLAS
jgi:integrase